MAKLILRKTLKKGVTEMLIYMISFVIANWDAITKDLPTSVKVILGMSIASAIRMGLNMLKIWLSNRKISSTFLNLLS